MRRVFCECDATSSRTLNMLERERERGDGARFFPGLLSSLVRKRGSGGGF
jgi:hypothetical protein